MLCYNSYSTPNLDGFSPYDLAFGHKMVLSHVLEIKPDLVVSGTFETYYEKLKKNWNYLCSRLQNFRSEGNNLMNRSKTVHPFQVGQLEYMYKAKGIIVHTGNMKIPCYFVEHLDIYRAIGPNNFLLMSLTDQIYPVLVEETRLNPGVISTTKGNVHTLAELKQVLCVGVKISSLWTMVLHMQFHTMFTCSLISFFHFMNFFSAYQVLFLVLTCFTPNVYILSEAVCFGKFLMNDSMLTLTRIY